MKIAIVRNSDNVVVNIANVPANWETSGAWSPPLGHTARTATGAQIGYIWNGSSYAAPPPEPGPSVISYAAFRSRLTAQELADVQTAAATDPTALDLVFIALSEGTVNLEGEKVSLFLDKMVAANAITQQRKTEILTP